MPDAKKRIVFIFILFFVVFLGLLIAYFVSQNQSFQENQSFSSIRDALSKSVSLECTYIDDKGVQSKTFIKNGAIRSDFVDPNGRGSIIMKDQILYVWNTKGGFKVTIPEAAAPQQTEIIKKGVQQQEKVITTLEQYKDTCQQAVVSDNVFILPTDVTFTDFSAVK